jgi:transposase IS116/IS110/IS902 family protein
MRPRAKPKENISYASNRNARRLRSAPLLFLGEWQPCHSSEGAESRRLEAIPGVGPLIATALVASIPDPHAFGSARDVSAWIGLVPKQNSTGGKERLGSISKAGNRSRIARPLYCCGPLVQVAKRVVRLNNRPGRFENLIQNIPISAVKHLPVIFLNKQRPALNASMRGRRALSDRIHEA